MPRRKRGGAVTRETWLIVLGVLVVIILVGVVYYTTTKSTSPRLPPPLTEAQKAQLRSACIHGYADPAYDFTTVEQCDTLPDIANRIMCKAWVANAAAYCYSLPKTEQPWCVALATKEPTKCDLTDNPVYCKAYVTKNPALCDSIDNDSTKRQCYATVKKDFSIIEQHSAELCGAQYEPST